MLYPLKFNPILKQMIWGGQKIPSKLNLEVASDAKIGEDYALSGLANDVSVVANGELAGSNLVDLIHAHKGALLGEKVYAQFGDKFPLLIKFIDSNDDLSIQVHPNDSLAKVKHDSFGKTEMWYVMDTEPGATLISGFTKKLSPEEFEKCHKENRLMDIMQQVETKKGDTFFIPAGKVHSIGKGNVIAEIQQTSNITYRIFDFNRTDKDGNPRELHHELAMDAIRFDDDETGKVNYERAENHSQNLVTCPYFTTNALLVSGELSRNYKNIDSFVILINTEGSCVVSVGDSHETLNAMECMLIPASIHELTFASKTEASLLEVWV